MSDINETQIVTVTTIDVNGEKYELQRNKSGQNICNGCALRLMDIPECHNFCADGYILKKVNCKNK